MSLDMDNFFLCPTCHTYQARSQGRCYKCFPDKAISPYRNRPRSGIHERSYKAFAEALEQMPARFALKDLHVAMGCIVAPSTVARYLHSEGYRYDRPPTAKGGMWYKEAD